MAKDKHFTDAMQIRRTDGVDSLFPDATAPQQTPAAAQQPAPKQTRSGAYRGQRRNTDDGRVAVTFKLPEETIEQLRTLCYWDRRAQWWVVNEGIQLMIKRYETERGEMQPIPE